MSATLFTHQAGTLAAAPAPAAPSLMPALLFHIRAWRQRANGRRALREMDARMLRDVGLTPTQAGMEIRKPWWQA